MIYIIFIPPNMIPSQKLNIMGTHSKNNNHDNAWSILIIVPALFLQLEAELVSVPLA